MSTRSRRLPALLAAGLALTAACGLTTAQQGDIRRWLLCEECVEGELARVVALGDRAVPPLAEALRGPSAAGRANMRRQTEGMYALGDSSAIGRQAYLSHYESNYIATYQLRAVIALDTIATPQAHAALIGALQGNVQYRRDVQRAIGAAAGVSLSVVGDSQQAPVDSVLRVDPEALVQDSAGHGLANVRVEFRVDSGGGAVSDSVRFTDASGRAGVRWRMGDSATTNVLRVAAGGQAVRLRAFSHDSALHFAFLVQPGNGTPGHPLTPAARIAVQDAWGTIQTGFNQTVRVDVPTLALAAIYNIVAGEVFVTNFVVPAPSSGLRLRVVTIGVPTAVSDSFDVVP